MDLETKDDEQLCSREESDDVETTSSTKELYESGNMFETQRICEQLYQDDPSRKDNLLLLGAVHFQLKDFSESIFYNQQAIRVDPLFAEAYSNLGNSLRELGDVKAATEFYLKAIKLNPRFSDAYNNLASTYLQMGQTKQAYETYQMALVLDPELADAQNNMGNLLKAQGRVEDARKAYLEAIRIKPDFAVAWSNLAGIFKDEGEVDTALSYYNEAIRLSPNLADAHSNLGNALLSAGKLDDAKKSFEKAIRIRPDFAVAHSNLGNVFHDMGHMDKAIAAYKLAIQIEPSYPDAHNNLGNAYRDIGEVENALIRYKKCLKLKPDHPYAYNNLGNLLKDRGLVKEAVDCYMTACRLMPRFAAAHNNLANILKEQGKIDQAIAHYQECIAVDPHFAPAFCNLGCTYKYMDRLDDAIQCFTTAIQLDPEFPSAYDNLGCAYRDAGRYDDAISCFRKALKLNPDTPDAKVHLTYTLSLVCDWRERKENVLQLRGILEEQLAMYDARSESNMILPLLSIQPFHLFSFSTKDIDANLFIRLQSTFAKQALQFTQLQKLPRFSFKARLPNQRLRVGYVSSNFGQFPISFMLQSVFACHQNNEIEVFSYATQNDSSSRIRKKIERESEHFVDLNSVSDYDAAKTINQDGIHVLINLDGYSQGARTGIFALQPAPIQISLPHGYCSSLCATFIQYTLVDKILAKAVDARGLSKLLVMDRTFAISDHKQSSRFVLDPSQKPTRAQYGLEEDKFVFACFSQGYKIGPQLLDSWAGILKRVPKGVFWLLRSPALMEANLRAEFRARGISDNKIIFSDIEPRDQHLKRIYLADLCLDSALCTAQTSAMDIIWAGIPMLTCSGSKMACKVTASILNHIGLSELVSESLKEYEDLAVGLAGNEDKIWAFRKTIEDARISSSLFDVKSWTASFENGLKSIWWRHENGKTPDDVIL